MVWSTWNPAPWAGSPCYNPGVTHCQTSSTANMGSSSRRSSTGLYLFPSLLYASIVRWVPPSTSDFNEKWPACLVTWVAHRLFSICLLFLFLVFALLILKILVWFLVRLFAYLKIVISLVIIVGRKFFVWIFKAFYESFSRTLFEHALSWKLLKLFLYFLNRSLCPCKTVISPARLWTWWKFSWRISLQRITNTWSHGWL